MKETALEFVCNLKQDTYHAFTDQLVFWSWRGWMTFMDIPVVFNGLEGFFFHYGWLIMLLWRMFNAFLDSKKRIRDYHKPEWETQVKPLLIAEEKRLRKRTFTEKMALVLRLLFR